MNDDEIKAEIKQIKRFWEVCSQGIEGYILGNKMTETKPPTCSPDNMEAWILWNKVNLVPKDLMVTGALPSEVN